MPEFGPWAAARFVCPLPLSSGFLLLPWLSEPKLSVWAALGKSCLSSRPSDLRLIIQNILRFQTLLLLCWIPSSLGPVWRRCELEPRGNGDYESDEGKPIRFVAALGQQEKQLPHVGRERKEGVGGKGNKQFLIDRGGGEDHKSGRYINSKRQEVSVWEIFKQEPKGEQQTDLGLQAMAHVWGPMKLPCAAPEVQPWEGSFSLIHPKDHQDKYINAPINLCTLL